MDLGADGLKPAPQGDVGGALPGGSGGAEPLGRPQPRSCSIAARRSAWPQSQERETLASWATVSMVAAGCGVLWLALRKDTKPMDRAQVVLFDDPAAAGVVIGTAAQRALRTSL